MKHFPFCCINSVVCCRFLPLLVAAVLVAIFPLGAETLQPGERTPAFPGAEGWGRYVTGGRGGTVYHVTNLKDSGPGSLRYAVEQGGARTIVFDVSGTIRLTSGLDISKGNLTIAGQTAPGDGICIADYPVTISAPNVIIRFIRFRPGNKMTELGQGEPDGFGAVDGSRIIIDHCSISWSVDECCSVYGNRFSTVQWCIISQSLRHGGHSKDTHGYGGMMGGEGASYHHNLLVHHDSRCPRLGERPLTGPRDTTDFRCNVMYNWSGQGCYGAENMNVNIVNNYYKPGRATTVRGSGIEKRICGVGVNEEKGNSMYHVWATIFAQGNVNSKYNGVTQNNWSQGIWAQIDSKYRNNAAEYNLDESKMRLSSPVKYYYVTTHTAEVAYERVLDYAGASLSRDSHDELMVSDTRNGEATYTGSGEGNAPGIIDNPTDNRPADAPDNWNPWPVLDSVEAPLDSDGDGMPDEWEIANGLNPNDPDDGYKKNADGYTNLELYLNGLVSHIVEAQNEGGLADGEIELFEPVADSYEVSGNTKEPSTWTFGHGIGISNTRNRSYDVSGSYLRVAGNVQHVLTLPDMAEVTAVRFEGKCRYTAGNYTDGCLSELGGEMYGEGQYSIPMSGGVVEFTVTPSAPVRDKLSFTFTGNSIDCIITLYTRTLSDGIDYVPAGVTCLEESLDNRWFNLQGIEIAEPSTPGLYIHNRRLVVKR